MKKYIKGILVIAALFCCSHGAVVRADSVEIQPLKVQTSLEKSEKKKGFVDITNPTSKTLNVNLYVDGFRQIDTDGNLAFFENEQIKKGIQLDYDSAIIGPYQTLRLFYIADGTKLPPGDVFGTLFAESKSDDHPGTKTTVRVGTLLIIENGTKGARHTEISRLDISPFQTGNFVSGLISVKNPAPTNSSTGFFPAMKVELQPWGGTSSFTGPLVFAGNTRTMHFELPSNQFGFYLVKVTANDAIKTKLLFIATGWWRLIGPTLILLVVGIIWLIIKYRPYRKVSDHQHRRRIPIK